MKPGKIIIFVILFVLGLTGCGTEENEPIIKDEEENYDETELLTTINIDGIDATEFYKGCLLTSIHEETPIGNGSLRIKSEINDKIQTYLISDANNKIYMMSRVPNTQLNKEIVVDIASTAFAFVTFHPLFSSMTANEFQSMKDLVTGNPYYQILEREVEKVIKSKKDIYDVNNNALISALNNLINDICVNSELPVDSIHTTEASRAGYEHSQINSDFIKAELNDNILSLSTKWWTPSYFGTVEQPDGTVDNKAVLARDDFGALDLLFNRTVCGPPLEYKFSEAGDYHFSFSRTNDSALEDLALKFTSNLLSAIGLKVAKSKLYGVSKLLADAFAQLGSSICDGKMSALEFLGITHNILITEMEQKPLYFAELFDFKEIDDLFNFVKYTDIYANKICIWYNTAKVSLNFIGRLTEALLAPATIDFTHTYSGVSLKIIKGNEQIGLKNKKLDIPLVVEIADMDSVYSYEYNYKVLFEVVEGGGKIQSEHVFLDLEHITFNGFKAETEWILGAEGEQKIRATVIDVITGNKVSSPVYFTADLTDLSLKKVTGDNQSGFPNKYLKNVLGVQIEMDKEYLSSLGKYYEIKYEVVSGGGELSETIKSPDSDNYAESQWKLGEKGEQKVQVSLLDKETKEAACEPVYFTATFGKVITGEATNITTNSASLSGQVVGYDMIDTDKYGVSVSTEASMENANFISAYSHTNGQFTVNISNLTPEKTYYWCAYAINNNSYIYGDIKTFTTKKEETSIEYLGENFTLELFNVQKVPQTINTYRMRFYISGFDLKKDVMPYIECTCTPEGYTHYAQTKTVSFKENGEINIVFENLYAGTNILSFGVLIKDSANDIRQDIGTKNFHVNYRALKDVDITYIGDKIHGLNSRMEWRANYKVTYIFENNPLTTTTIATHKGDLSISGLTHYSQSSEESTDTNMETYTIGIPEDQYDIDWNNYQAKLKNGKVVFSYYEWNHGNVYGHDDIEKSTAFDYNQFPSIEIIAFDNYTEQNGILVDWGSGFMGSCYGTASLYWNCTGRLFLRFATFQCEHDLPAGAIVEEETIIAGAMNMNYEPIQYTKFGTRLHQNLSYDNSISLKATFPNDTSIRSSNTFKIKSNGKYIRWSIQP